MSVLSETGAAHLAKLLYDDVGAWYIAVGSGDPAWDNLQTVPEPSQASTALEAHIGHFVATSQYVTPDANGTIRTAGDEAWAVSVSPTRYIHLQAEVDFADASDATIRELAVYIDATPDTSHEAQTYLPVADLADLGVLLNMSRRPPWFRSPSDNGEISFVFFVGEL